jgi:hypothetical protein
MTLRESLGGDVRRIYEQVDALLDREDGIVALFDGGRVVTYAQGFGASASQLEFLGVELERALRHVVGRPLRKGRRQREGDQGDRRGGDVNRNRHGAARPVLQLANKIA